MGKFMSILVAFVGVLVLCVLIQAQDQSGFISIDCGAPKDVQIIATGTTMMFMIVFVKMLSPSCVHGYQQFQVEVKLLMRVHHKSLTSLVGYCNEGNNKCLIYEYMANGNLQEHLSGKHSKTKFFTWEDRLHIAMDAASGLEYLQNGCKPTIIHRDIKSTNILLNEHFQAKLSDFGLSKIIPSDGGTHVSTVIAGTPGYLDPEYYTTNRLTEKSDVYSFGVVGYDAVECLIARMIRMLWHGDCDTE
ncbi:hypothetical protein VNO78_12730 [Psophocarpus tetragonolobus]|uniref:Protein kinase domain-containing protein n=1 Tax=Psophocarpus tetragonolobus TaxID=3891 RepID=A0AAN9XP60_PSOTE